MAAENLLGLSFLNPPSTEGFINQLSQEDKVALLQETLRTRQAPIQETNLPAQAASAPIVAPSGFNPTRPAPVQAAPAGPDPQLQAVREAQIKRALALAEEARVAPQAQLPTELPSELPVQGPPEVQREPAKISQEQVKEFEARVTSPFAGLSTKDKKRLENTQTFQARLGLSEKGVSDPVISAFEELEKNPNVFAEKQDAIKNIDEQITFLKTQPASQEIDFSALAPFVDALNKGQTNFAGASAFQKKKPSKVPDIIAELKKRRDSIQNNLDRSRVSLLKGATETLKEQISFGFGGASGEAGAERRIENDERFSTKIRRVGRDIGDDFDKNNESAVALKLALKPDPVTGKVNLVTLRTVLGQMAQFLGGEGSRLTEGDIGRQFANSLPAIMGKIQLFLTGAASLDKGLIISQLELMDQIQANTVLRAQRSLNAELDAFQQSARSKARGGRVDVRRLLSKRSETLQKIWDELPDTVKDDYEEFAIKEGLIKRKTGKAKKSEGQSAVAKALSEGLAEQRAAKKKAKEEREARRKRK